MSKAHYDALEAMLPEGLQVFRGSAPKEPAGIDYPYVVVGGNAGDESTEAYAGDPDSLNLRFKLTYAGLSFDSVLITISRVRSALVGRKLIVSGHSCGTLRPQAVADIRTDFDVIVPDAGNPLYAVDEFPVLSAH